MYVLVCMLKFVCMFVLCMFVCISLYVKVSLYVCTLYVCMYQFVCMLENHGKYRESSNIQTYIPTFRFSTYISIRKVILVCMLEPISTIKHMPFRTIHTYIHFKFGTFLPYIHFDFIDTYRRFGRIHQKNIKNELLRVHVCMYVCRFSTIFIVLSGSNIQTYFAM